jgi:DNA polymerase III alpha subunit
MAFKIIKDDALRTRQQATVGTINEIKEMDQKNNEKYGRINATNFDGVKEDWLIFASQWNIFKNSIKTHETYVCIGKKKSDESVFIVNTIKNVNEILT